MSAAEVFLWALGAYRFAGGVFGLAFVTVGVGRIDPAARGTSPAFRALIFPGSVTLWPLLAANWIRRKP